MRETFFSWNKVLRNHESQETFSQGTRLSRTETQESCSHKNLFYGTTKPRKLRSLGTTVFSQKSKLREPSEGPAFRKPYSK
jgi:hypothetical protein